MHESQVLLLLILADWIKLIIRNARTRQPIKNPRNFIIVGRPVGWMFELTTDEFQHTKIGLFVCNNID